MTQQTITPPFDLVQQWDREWRAQQSAPVIGWSANLLAYVATRAAQWGADQELEACCALMDDWGLDGEDLMLCRRPKPPSLKEQALDDLHIAFDRGCLSEGQADTIRCALEQLPNHE